MVLLFACFDGWFLCLLLLFVNGSYWLFLFCGALWLFVLILLFGGWISLCSFVSGLGLDSVFSICLGFGLLLCCVLVLVGVFCFWLLVSSVVVFFGLVCCFLRFGCFGFGCFCLVSPAFAFRLWCFVLLLWLVCFGCLTLLLFVICGFSFVCCV